LGEKGAIEEVEPATGIKQERMTYRMPRNAFWNYCLMELFLLIIIFGTLFTIFFQCIAILKYFNLGHFSLNVSFYSLYLAAFAVPLWMLGRYWYIMTFRLKFTDKGLGVHYSIFGFQKNRDIAFSSIRKFRVRESSISSFNGNRYVAVTVFDEQQKKEREIVLGFFSYDRSHEIEKRLQFEVS
jgi:hypothetical protein